MATKNLTVNINHIDPRVGDTFGFQVSKNGEEVTFADGIGWNKTFVEDGSTLIALNKLTQFNPDLDVENLFGLINGIVYDSLIQSDGKIIIVGNITSYAGLPVSNIVRINTDGTRDVSFDVSTNNTVLCIAETPTAYFFGGDFTTFSGQSINRIAKTNKTTGALNTTFRNNVMSSTVNPGANGSVACITPDDGGNNLYVGGYFTRFNSSSSLRQAFVRINDIGNVSTTTVGQVLSPPSTTPFVNTIHRQSDNKIILGGNISDYIPLGSFSPISTGTGLLRINTDFSGDATFFGSTIFTGSNTGFNGAVTRVISDTSYVYVVGDFTTLNGSTAKSIVRLDKTTGSLSTNYGGGAVGSINDIQILSTGDIILCGGFTQWQTTNVGGLIRISSTGTLEETITLNNYATSITKLPSSDSFLLGGNFSNAFISSGTSNTFTSIPIAFGDIEQTAINTYDNLVAFNSGTGIAYSIDGTTVTMTFTTEDVDIVTFDYFDTDEHVEIDYVLEPPTFEDIVTDAVTRSPIFYNTDATSLSTVDYEVKAFEGNIVSTQPLITTVRKNKLLTNQTGLYFEASEYLKEKLQITPTEFLSSEYNVVKNLPPNFSKWALVTEKRYLLNTLVDEKKNYNFIIDGYLEEFEQQGLPNILMNGLERDLISGQHYQLFFKTNKLVSISMNVDGVVSSITLPPTILFLNTEYVKYLNVDTTAGKKIKYVFEYESASIEVVFNCSEECKYLNQYLVFKNKYGVLDTLPVNKKTIKSISTTKVDYKRSILDINGNYNELDHTNRVFNLNGTESITLNTPLLPDYMNKPIQDVSLSEQIWLFDGERLTPVIKEDDNISFKTSLNDKMVQYTLRVKKSHSKIKQIK